MDSFHEDDNCTAQSASALPFYTTAGMRGSHSGQLPTESQAQPALQPHPGLRGRKQYSKEQWEARKPIIEQLYYHEEKPYTHVIEILEKEHDFFPTYVIQKFSFSNNCILVNINVLTMTLRRSQFYRKIKDWGLGKNIKEKDMLNLVQDLSQRGSDGEELPVELRGKQIDPVKIQRWQKRHGRVKNVICQSASSPSMSKSSELSK
jgi:Clr5 domain